MFAAKIDRYRGCVAACALGLLALPQGVSGEPQSAPVADSPVTLVRPLPPHVLAPEVSAAVTRELIGKYYSSILHWGRIVTPQVRPVPAHPAWRYLGLPQHTENDVRPTAYAAMVLGFLAQYQPPPGVVDEREREPWRSQAIGLLRYLTASHVSGGGACVNGKAWGKQWQSAMWARAVGLAGWFLWNELDPDLQTAIARLVEFEADRFLQQPPKSSLRDDTGAEENAWNALITSLACNLIPAHPRAAAWEEASLRYLYNTFSVAADAHDATPGDGGKPIKDWVTTVNAHDDFTVENHRLVHMGYLKNTVSELQENTLPWLIRGRQVPAACLHHAGEVFGVLVACMGWDGGPVYFAGTDWKTYHEQCTEIVLYTMLSLRTADRTATFLERTALDSLTRQQQAQGGYYNVRRDLEYGGLCATRLIACCLAHGLLDAPPEPITAAEFDRLASGTRHLVAGKTVVHRTPSKFASFTWAQKRLALTLPRDGTWVLWPHFASYLGILDGRDSSQGEARLDKIQVDVQPTGFRVSGALQRCRERLVQDFCFVSPPGDYTVYFERLRADADFQLKSRETGVIGLEYPLGANQRVLHGPWGTLTTTGYGGEARVHALNGAWLNIDNRIGYVVLRGDGRPNVIRYHDAAQGVGRVPQLQEWISLVGEPEAQPPASPCWTCVVSFVNQTANETERSAATVRFAVQDRLAVCKIGEETVVFEVSD